MTDSGDALSRLGRRHLLLDEIPDQLAERNQFRQYLSSLTLRPEFRRANLRVDVHQIGEVRSHDHVLLQCIDVVLGAMQFRLNEKHLERPSGAARRGKRTIAKEQVYEAILGQIQQLRPRFNIGILESGGTPRSHRASHCNPRRLVTEPNGL